MPRGASFTNLSVAGLNSLLRKSTGELSRLKRERARVQKKLDGIDARISRISGGRVLPSGRARNSKSLVQTMRDVLAKAGKPLAVGDILSGVAAAGYRSGSDNFRALINQTLIKERKQFAKVERGVYQLKK